MILLDDLGLDARQIKLILLRVEMDKHEAVSEARRERDELEVLARTRSATLHDVGNIVQDLIALVEQSSDVDEHATFVSSILATCECMRVALSLTQALHTVMQFARRSESSSLSASDDSPGAVHAFPCTPFNVRGMIERIATVMRGRSEAKKLVVAITVEDGLDEGDVHSLAHFIFLCLYNLIGNAIKFTDAGGVHIAARLAPLRAEDRARHGGRRQSPRCLELCVSDTGRGLPLDSERLFGFGSQARRADAADGSGIGLWLVAMLCEHAFGTGLPDAERLVGPELGGKGGTSFTFRVPLFDPTDEEKEIPRISLHLNVDAEIDILLVEDSELQRRLLRLRIAKIMPNARVTEAATGEEAVRVCEQEALAKNCTTPFALVFMDFCMSDNGCAGLMNGAQTIERIVATGFAGHIVGCTASVERGSPEVTSMIEAGARFVIAKPIHPLELRYLLLGSDRAL